MNICHFLGNLTRDPDIIPGATKLCKFGVAINEKFKGKERVTFLDCEAWGPTAELIEKYFKKGKPIILHARVKMDQWEDKQSQQKRTKLVFVVERVDFVPGGSSNAPSPRNQTEQDGNHESFDGSGPDEIPF